MSRATAARLDRDLPDRDLADLPEGMRWREWMMRAEAAIFATPKPVARETLAGLVGDACRLDALIADINDELKARPYEIVFVAGGYQFRTRPRHAETKRALAGTKDAGPPSFTRLEMLALSAIAYQQPVTRAELSRLVGHDISRDILGRLKSLGVIAPGPRAPQPGAPIAWVTIGRCQSAGKREIAPVSDGRCWKWRDQNGLASRICCKYENDGWASASSLIFPASNRKLSRPLHEFSMRV